MEYENFDSHLEEFENSDEFDPSDDTVDSYLDFENDIPDPDSFDPEDCENPFDILAGSEEDIMEAEIRRTYLDAFPWDDA